ncbi:MAG: HPF/RaiA family ribosome-associated protein [Dokdonella sp.]
MKIQFNTDKNIQGHEALETRVSGMIEHSLAHVATHLTRVEVHLSDTNAAKGGDDDKRCTLEARLEHERPVGVSHEDKNVEKAVRGACDKLKSRLEGIIERRRNHQT